MIKYLKMQWLFVGIIFLIPVNLFSQVKERLYLGAGYPFSLSKDAEKTIKYDIGTDKKLYYSFSFTYELCWKSNWHTSIGIGFNSYNFWNDSVSIRLNQYAPNIGIGYDWNLTDRLIFKNTLLFGFTQLWQNITVESGQFDILSSYQNNEYNQYSDKSEVFFYAGHSSNLSYRISHRTSLYANLTYSFNRDKKNQLIAGKPVFRNILTPSVGLVFELKSKDYSEAKPFEPEVIP